MAKTPQRLRTGCSESWLRIFGLRCRKRRTAHATLQETVSTHGGSDSYGVGLSPPRAPKYSVPSIWQDITRKRWWVRPVYRPHPADRLQVCLSACRRCSKVPAVVRVQGRGVVGTILIPAIYSPHAGERTVFSRYSGYCHHAPP